MSLADERWTRVSVHAMIATFLQAEKDRFARGLPPWRTERMFELPNLDDPQENADRMRLLYQGRRHLLGEIPPDTEWFDVRSLRAEHVDALLMLRAARGRVRIVDYAVVEAPLLRCGPEEWAPVILWGHRREGPFTVLDGTHRLLAWVGSARVDFAVPVCVGLSPSFCRWHAEDPDAPLLHDMWR